MQATDTTVGDHIWLDALLPTLGGPQLKVEPAQALNVLLRGGIRYPLTKGHFIYGCL